MRTFSSAVQERELETTDKAPVSIDPKEIPKPSKYSFHDNRFSQGKKVFHSKKIGKKELKMDQKWEHDKWEHDKGNSQDKKSFNNLKINIIKKEKKLSQDLKISITKNPKAPSSSEPITIVTPQTPELPPLPVSVAPPQMAPPVAHQMVSPIMIPQMIPQMISPIESNYMYPPYMASNGQVLFMTESGLFVPSPAGYYPTFVSPVRSKAIPIVKPCD